MKKGSTPLAGYLIVLLSFALIALFIYLGQPDCTFKDIECFESYATERTIGIRLMNNYGYPIGISGAEMYIDGRQFFCDYDSSPERYEDLQIFDLIFYNCDIPIPIMDKKNYKIDVKLKVWSNSPAFAKTNKGYLKTVIHPPLDAS